MDAGGGSMTPTSGVAEQTGEQHSLMQRSKVIRGLLGALVDPLSIPDQLFYRLNTLRLFPLLSTIFDYVRIIDIYHF